MEQDTLSDELLQLRRLVLLANLYLSNNKLAALTWGNVSGITQDRKYMVIKPSGVTYEEMTPEHMVVIDMHTGAPIPNTTLRPSTDTPTHIVLYQRYPQLTGICHTHSTYATSWAQAGRDIPCLGTTHADNVLGDIPCTRDMLDTETERDYELNTANVIVEELTNRGMDITDTPGILVREHGVFTWSTKSAQDSVEKATALEEIAKMALLTHILRPDKWAMNPPLQRRHFSRKHGPGAYYGQTNTKR